MDIPNQPLPQAPLESSVVSAQQVSQVPQNQAPLKQHLTLLLAIFASVSLATLLLFWFFVLRKLYSLASEVGSQPPKNALMIFFALLVYPLVLFSLYVYFKRAIKTKGKIAENQKVLALVVLIGGGFLFFGLELGSLIMQTILPIYNLTAQF